MKKLRIALLEVGHWHGPMYIEALKDLDVSISAISEQDEKALSKWGAELNCATYNSFVKLLDSEIIDFVFGFGRHCDMLDIAKELVSRNVPFAMEKPMALNWEQLKEVAEEATEKELFAGVAFVRRLDEITQTFQTLRDNGKLGHITHYHSRFIGGSTSRYVNAGCPWMLRINEAGGGCMINFGTHAFDQFCLLVDEPIVSVYSRNTNDVHNEEIEDMSTTILTSASGSVALLESGYTLPNDPKEHYLTITTDKLYYSNDIRRWSAHTEVIFRDKSPSIPLYFAEASYAKYIEDTLHRFCNGEKPVADINDMVKVLRLVNAAYESSQKNKVIEIG